MELLITENQYDKLTDTLSLKKTLFKFWDKFGGEINDNFLNMFGFKNRTKSVDGLDIYTLRRFLIEWRGLDESLNMAKEIAEKNPHKIDFQPWSGGYIFDFDTDNVEINDNQIYLDVLVNLKGGTVDLIMVGGETQDLEDAINNNDYGYEIENEIEDVISDYMIDNITNKTGIPVVFNSVLYKNSREG
jgi:hypothetical protein